MKTLAEQVEALPREPGVYAFIGEGGRILYIGKATSLRDRVRSYLRGDIEQSRSRFIKDMVEKAAGVEYEVTDSVLEALVLEAYKIKTHKPHYNTIGLDDKSFNYVIITNEAWPRLLSIREHDIDKRFSQKEIKYLFGPFPKGTLLNEALRLLRKIFPYYDTRNPVDIELEGPQRNKIIFNQQIGRYPSAEMTQKEYQRLINHIRLFFEGKKKQLVRSLTREMERLAKDEAFEKAAEIKRQLFALEHIQDVSLMGKAFQKPNAAIAGAHPRIEAYDIAHMKGEAMVGVMVVVEDGEPKKSEYRKFNIRFVAGVNDTAALEEVLERRLAHNEWQLPRFIVVDGGKAQVKTMERVLSRYGLRIPVVGVVKDEKHKPKDIIGSKDIRSVYEDDILLANAESHRFAIGFHRSKSRKARR